MAVRVPLRDVAEINPSLGIKLADDDVCSFIPMESVDEVSAQIVRPQTRRYLDVKKGFTPFREGDAIVAKITPCMENGKAAVARRLIGGVGFGSTEFHVVRPTRALVGDWFHYFWQQPETRRVAERHMTGSGGQKRVPAAYLEELRIPLPPRDKQERLVALLKRTDRLRHMRRFALDMSEGLLAAVFLEMFGDPVRNARSWPVCELEELATVERGKFTPRPRNDPSYYGGIFPFIQTGDITNSKGRLRSWTQSLNESGVRVSRSFPVGTVVIAIVGATIGMTAILDVEVYCPDSVVGIQVKPDTATKEYIEFLLRFWRPVFLAQAPETARANINLDSLRPLRIPVPPLQLQQKFTAFVERVECLRLVHREALRQADHLFQTLLHEAFGEEE